MYWQQRIQIEMEPLTLCVLVTPEQSSPKQSHEHEYHTDDADNERS